MIKYLLIFLAVFTIEAAGQADYKYSFLNGDGYIFAANYLGNVSDGEVFRGELNDFNNPGEDIIIKQTALLYENIYPFGRDNSRGFHEYDIFPGQITDDRANYAGPGISNYVITIGSGPVKGKNPTEGSVSWAPTFQWVGITQPSDSTILNVETDEKSDEKNANKGLDLFIPFTATDAISEASDLRNINEITGNDAGYKESDELIYGSVSTTKTDEPLLAGNFNTSAMIEDKSGGLEPFTSGSNIDNESNDYDIRDIDMPAKLFTNPSNKNMILELELRKNCILKIDIIDFSGNVIRNVRNDSYDAGKLTLNVNTTGLAGGAYIVKAEMDGYTKLMEMMKIK